MITDSHELPVLEPDLGEVIFSCLQELEAGREPNREQLERDYPKFAAELRSFFLNQDRVEKLAAPLRSIVRPSDTSRESIEKTLVGGADQLRFGANRALGDYELLSEIGRGGMGVVYQARQRGLNRLVALKLIGAGQLASDSEKRRFRAEAETAASLDHPHIIPVYEVGEVDEQLFFSMKYIETGSLSIKLERFKANPRFAARLLATLARAVHFAHQRGILHRDLKPGNILLDADDCPYITDFGLAKRLQASKEASEVDLSRSTDMIGSPLYMAPEQASPARGPATTATDVYGLGCILYAMLAGHAPFRATTLLETLDLVLRGEPPALRPINPLVDRELEIICLKCLDKDPQKRYSSAEAMADDLDRFLSGRPIVARSVPAWKRLRKWARRKPALASLVGVGMVLPIVGIAAILVHNARLQKSANEANHHQMLARQAYQRARDALGEMLKQFDGVHAEEIPQLRELERRQAEKALAFYEGALADQDDPDPAIRRDTAFACKCAGDLRALLGRPDQAKENYQRAISLFAGLPSEEKNSAECLFQLAYCYNHLGLLANHARQWRESEEFHRQALGIMEAKIGEIPNSVQWRAGAAETEHFLGALFQVSGKSEDADQHLQRSAAILTELIVERPTEESFLVKLVDTEIDLALIRQYSQRPAEAQRLFEQAFRHVNALIDAHPSNGEYKLSLAALYSNWGLLHQQTGQLNEAVAKVTKAIDLGESFLTREPNHVVARLRTRNAHGARAQAYEALDRWADAVPDWDRVVKLEGDAGDWEHRVLRTRAMTHAGIHAGAIAEAKLLANDSKLPLNGQYDLACVLALACGQVQGDDRINAAERRSLSEEYATRALALLRRLSDQGYFNDVDHAKNLTTDADLKSLRERADFKALVPRPDQNRKRSD